MKIVKNIVLWVLSAFLLLMALVLFTDRFLSGFLMLAAVLLCNPLVLSLIAKRGKRVKKKICIPGVIILFLAAIMTMPSSNQGATESVAAEAASNTAKMEEADAAKTGETSELMVHFMDIGQGDAALIACDGEYMLIDAGDNDKGTAVQNYLTKQGVSKLKYVIGTHPDADHIGGLDVILYKFDCETIMMPDITNDTATYRDVIDTMDAKGYRNTLPRVGDTYTLGGAEFTILGPRKTYGDTNNSSIVLRLVHGENSFLFAGDAEEEAETDILNGDIMVDADVLKVGHHGSRTASSKAFLQAVSPTYAVISCAEDNSYGHPHAETLNNLRAMGVQVFRTDEQGTIVATSDGQQLEWNCAPSETWKAGESTQSADHKTSAADGAGQNEAAGSDTAAESAAMEQTATQPDETAQNEEKQEQLTGAGGGNGSNFETGEAPVGANYIGNKRNGKLHRASCHTLPKAENQAIFSTREEAVAAGYDDPCGNCKP
ncbi:MAG: MBL fold metallo-hydrolase [Lachnospiraceae bacterium]|nr:MBL fold metallo-hydrolase [Lachnospiraceae bacterium]